MKSSKKKAPEGWLPVRLSIGSYALIPLSALTPEHVTRVKMSILKDGGVVGAPQRAQRSARVALGALGASSEERKKAPVLQHGWWTIRGDATEKSGRE